MQKTSKDAEQLLKNAPKQLQLCFKLAELEREWIGIVGEEFALRSILADCQIEEDGAAITLRAADAGTAASLNFLKAKLARMLENYLGFPLVRIDIKVGRIKRVSGALPPLPIWKRRAPAIIDKEAVERELAFTSAVVEDTELAIAFARIKALVERRKKRRV